MPFISRIIAWNGSEKNSRFLVFSLLGIRNKEYENEVAFQQKMPFVMVNLPSIHKQFDLVFNFVFILNSRSQLQGLVYE